MSEIKVCVMEVGMLPTNCYFLYREEGDKAPTEAIVIDPGDEGERIYEALTAKGLSVKAILLTHAHFDHILGVKALKEKTGAPLYASEMEMRLCKDAEYNLSSEYGKGVTVTPDVFLKDGEEVNAAGIRLKVLSTPGHTEGSCCYYVEEDHLLFSGDTVFKGSVGRTDFPTGSGARIVKSIEEKILPLPDETLVFPGHGPVTNVGTERRENPYFN